MQKKDLIAEIQKILDTLDSHKLKVVLAFLKQYR